MKSDKLYDAITDIDEKYITEAAEYKPKKKNYFTMKNLSIAVAALFMLMVVAVGVSAIKKDRYESAPSGIQSITTNGFMAADSVAKGDYYMEDMVTESAMEAETGGYYDGMANVENAVSNIPESTNAKLIKTENMSVETVAYMELINKIKDAVTNGGGYIENMSEYGTGKGYNYRQCTMNIRIPQGNLESLSALIESNATVISMSSNVSDVTLDYVDVESHIKALKVEQESLLKLLEKAESLDDIIIIQSQLTNVRYEIESYESRLRTMDNKVNYSTIHLTISEVKRETEIIEEKDFFSEALSGLMDNLYDIAEGFRDFGVWFISSIPYIIIWAVIIIVAIIIIRKIVKKIKKNN